MQESLLEKLKPINDDIKNKKFAPFYFLYGEEGFFISSIIANIKKEFVDNTGMNIKVYEEDHFDLNGTIEYISSMPIMNEKKLIIFKNVEIFRSKKEKAAHIDKLIDTMDKARDLNIIYIAMNETEYKYAEKYTKGNKIADFVAKNGILIDSRKLRDDELAKYVKSRFTKGGYEIDAVNTAYFVRNAGKSINTLYNEADKLMAYLEKPQKITKEVIDICISENVEDTVFTLIDLVNNHRQNEAYKIYADLLSGGNEPFSIFANFTSNFEQLLVAKDLTEQSKTLKDICEVMKLPDWRVRKLLDANKGMTKDAIVTKLNKITKLQYDYMKGDLNMNLMLELLFA